MRTRKWFALTALVIPLGARGSLAQTTAAPPQATTTEAPSPQMPAPPWPRVVDAAGATLTIYEPQAEEWDKRELQASSAVTVRGASAERPSYGVVHLTARTDVDKEQGLISLHDVRVTSAEFPGQPGRAEEYKKAIQDAGVLTSVFALARIQAGLEATQASRNPRHTAVQNAPPRMILSERPAILVLIDGSPVLRPIAGTPLSRVVNTRALILRDASAFYLYVGNHWVAAETIDGPWSNLGAPSAELDRAKDAIVQEGPSASAQVDLLKATPDATVYVSTVPAEIIETSGPPELAPLGGTGLWYVTNTTRDVFLREATSQYYVLLAGRWFESRALTGPWQFVPADELPGDFARISKSGPKGNVLASVPGTPEAKESLIANQIPQTAAVPRTAGPTLNVTYDGSPRFAPIESTPLAYATNSATPVLAIDPTTYYALSDGVWFSASDPMGPWFVATTVPPVIYTIPASSPLHYVTYVYIDGSNPSYVYEAAAPGYLGTVAVPSGVVVYGTGYSYPPWIGDVWYGGPATFGFGAGLALGVGFGFWFHSPFVAPWWGPRFAFPAYARPAYVTNFNVYNRWRGAGVVARPSYVPPRVPQRGIGGGPRTFDNVPLGRPVPGNVYRTAPRPLPPGPIDRTPGPLPPGPAYRTMPAPLPPGPSMGPSRPAPAPMPPPIAPTHRPAGPQFAPPPPAYRSAPPAFHAAPPPPAPMRPGGLPTHR